MFLTITLVIFFILMFLFFTPNSIVIKVNIKADDYFTNITKLNGMENEIKIKLLNVFTVYKKELFTKGKKKIATKKNKNLLSGKFTNRLLKKLINHIRLDKFVLSLGFNFDDPIANSYVNASINTILCMYINHNQRKFNLHNLYYQTYISENLLFLNFESIINISLIDTIKVIAKEYFNKDRNGKKKEILSA